MFTTTFSIRMSRMPGNRSPWKRRDLRRLDRGPLRPDHEHLPDVRGEALLERDDVRPRIPRADHIEDAGDLADMLAPGHEDRGALRELVMLHDLLVRKVEFQRRARLVRVLG